MSQGTGNETHVVLVATIDQERQAPRLTEDGNSKRNPQPCRWMEMDGEWMEKMVQNRKMMKIAPKNFSNGAGWRWMENGQNVDFLSSSRLFCANLIVPVNRQLWDIIHEDGMKPALARECLVPTLLYGESA